MTGEPKPPKPSDHWCTPEEITSLLPEFDLDPCSNPNSTVRAKRRVMLPEDGLSVPWEGLVFCNPPYSNVMPWAEKAVDSRSVARTLFLLKLDPTTRWYRHLAQDGCAEVYLVRKRIKFAGAASCANFPSVFLSVGSFTAPGVRSIELGTALTALRREGWIW